MINKTFALITIVLFLSSNLLAQQDGSCKVLLPEIAGTYDGQCKDGLANGKGTSKGEDEYSGTFTSVPLRSGS